MTEIEGTVRCPRGHLTAAGYQYCTTCGERIATDPVVRDLDVPVLGAEPTGFALPPDVDRPPAAPRPKGGRLAGLRARGRKTPDEPVAPSAPALATVDVAPPPAGAEKPTRRSRPSFRRKPRAADGPAHDDAGPSLLPPDLRVVANQPPTTGPPEVEPPPVGAVSVPPTFRDVEFAIGPGVHSIATYDRVEVGESIASATTRTARPKRRGPEIPTRVLVAVLAVVAAIALAIIVFISRGPSEPSAVPTSVATQVPQQTAAPVPTPGTFALSEECANAFAFAAAHAAEAQAPQLQQRTLELCGTPDEWTTAARQYPAAIGVADATAVGDDDLLRICAGVSDAPVCQVAEAAVHASAAASSPPDSSVSPLP